VCHHNDMATYVIEFSGDGMPFPSHFGTSQFTVGAFNNLDHDEATRSGIGGSHDTVSSFKKTRVQRPENLGLLRQ